MQSTENLTIPIKYVLFDNNVTAGLNLPCQRQVEQAQRVNYLGMVEFLPRIKGVYTGATDGFVSTGETNDWCPTQS